MNTMTPTLDAAGINAAAARIRDLHPPQWIGGMKAKQADAFIRRLHELEQAELDSMENLHIVAERGWIDVQLENGQFVGQWIDAGDSIERAALSCAYSWSPIKDAGPGLKDQYMNAVNGVLF